MLDPNRPIREADIACMHTMFIVSPSNMLVSNMRHLARSLGYDKETQVFSHAGRSGGEHRDNPLPTGLFEPILRLIAG